MNEQKNHSKKFKKTELSLIELIVMGIFIFVLLYSVFLGYSLFSVNGELVATQDEINIAQEQLDVLHNENIRPLVVSMDAMKIIDEADVKWSEVITYLNDATPDDIVYRSYTGSDDGSIKTSVVANSFKRVGDLIEILKQKPFIKTAFVPSIVKGSNPVNTSVYSFSLNVEYEK